MELNQYDILLVDLDPTKGSEMKKTRPAVIISPVEMNNNLNTIIIAPMTTSSKSYPTRIHVQHNKKIGWIVLDQLRTIDKMRSVKKVGKAKFCRNKKCKGSTERNLCRLGNSA